MTENNNKFTNLIDATKAAVDLSKVNGFSQMVLSKGEYHVEGEPTMVRVWEELIATYENGELSE